MTFDSEATARPAPPGDLPAAVVFDCDGVLLESVEVKTRAFLEVYADYPQHHSAIAAHHQDNLGISRFEKFRWIERSLFSREPGAGDLEALGLAFSQRVADGVRHCPEVAGAGATLSQLSQAGIPLFVASGTPQDELEATLDDRGWSHFFTGVHGSPRTKPDVLVAIARQLNVAPSSLVFVGDGASDHQAAQETGTVFVLRETAAQAERFLAYQGPRIDSLDGFCERLPSFVGAPAANALPTADSGTIAD